MGNRCVITTRKHDIGVYLHWNGGRDSVEAFLDYCKKRKFRAPENDCYGWARLCQVVGNYFGGSLSIGISNFKDFGVEWLDNGVYVIENWDIVDRENFTGKEQNEYDHDRMLREIDSAQPDCDRIYKADESLVEAIHV